MPVFLLAFALTWINAKYDELTGRPPAAHHTSPWLRSMRDAAPMQSSVTVVEAVLMGSVMLAAIALTIWFFLLAGSPIPNQ